MITIEDGNSNFRVSANFLLNWSGLGIIRYFGHDREVRIPNSIQILCKSCFSCCISLSTLVFESGSTLTRIEEFAFSYCSSLKSICIPSSVQILCRLCFCSCTSLSVLTFESGSKLHQIQDGAFSGCFLLDLSSLPIFIRHLIAQSHQGGDH
jgi:hypothetical protein